MSRLQKEASYCMTMFRCESLGNISKNKITRCGLRKSKKNKINRILSRLIDARHWITLGGGGARNARSSSCTLFAGVLFSKESRVGRESWSGARSPETLALESAGTGRCVQNKYFQGLDHELSQPARKLASSLASSPERILLQRCQQLFQIADQSGRRKTRDRENVRECTHRPRVCTTKLRSSVFTRQRTVPRERTIRRNRKCLDALSM